MHGYKDLLPSAGDAHKNVQFHKEILGHLIYFDSLQNACLKHYSVSRKKRN